MIEGIYTELTQDSALFEFNGVQYDPKMFYHHGKNQNFDDLLKWANESHKKGIIGILLTASFLWNKLTDAQKNMIEPKVKVMWCGETNAITTWGNFSVYGNCFLWQAINHPSYVELMDDKTDLEKYFTVSENVIGGSEAADEIRSLITTCPHCGKKIF